MNDFGWLILILVGITVIIAMLSGISNSRADRKAKEDAAKVLEETARHAEALRLEIALAEQRRKDELVNRSRLSISALEQDGSVNLKWDINSPKGGENLSLQIYRSKTAVASYSEAREDGKLVVSTSEYSGEYFDKETRRKGGEFHYTAYLAHEGSIISTSTSVVSVLSNLRRRVDQLKSQKYVLEQETANEKAKEDYLRQRTNTSEAFIKNVDVEQELLQIQENTGQYLSRSQPYSVFGKTKRKALDSKKSDYIKKLVSASLSIAKKDVYTKREANELLGSAFKEVSNSKNFSDIQERVSAYSSMIDSLEKEMFVKDHNIDLIDLLANFDEQSALILTGEITDSDYDGIN